MAGITVKAKCSYPDLIINEITECEKKRRLKNRGEQKHRYGPKINFNVVRFTHANLRHQKNPIPGCYEKNVSFKTNKKENPFNILKEMSFK